MSKGYLTENLYVSNESRRNTSEVSKSVQDDIERVRAGARAVVIREVFAPQMVKALKKEPKATAAVLYAESHYNDEGHSKSVHILLFTEKVPVVLFKKGLHHFDEDELKKVCLNAPEGYVSTYNSTSIVKGPAFEEFLCGAPDDDDNWIHAIVTRTDDPEKMTLSLSA